MTTTTTDIVATNCVVFLDKADGVPQDISGSTTAVEMPIENKVAEFRTFGLMWPQRRVTGKDATVTLKVIDTTAAAEAAQLLKNWFFGGNDRPRTLQVHVPDSEIGSFRLMGEFVLVNLSQPFDSEADDVVRLEAELRPDGAVSYATSTS